MYFKNKYSRIKELLLNKRELTIRPSILDPQELGNKNFSLFFFFQHNHVNNDKPTYRFFLSNLKVWRGGSISRRRLRQTRSVCDTGEM